MEVALGAPWSLRTAGLGLRAGGHPWVCVITFSSGHVGGHGASGACLGAAVPSPGVCVCPEVGQHS